MKCTYCGKETEFLTTVDKPICYYCAEKARFSLCTEVGKYIADSNFVCDHICNDCVYSN